MDRELAPAPPALRAVDWAVALLGMGVAARIVPRIAARVPYPYDLEWMEGGMLVHALRLTRGEPLYTTPSPDWIPYVYTPGYAALVAAGSTVGGLDYVTGRVISALGTGAALAALVALGARRGHAAWGVVGALVFLGTWRASGAFFELVRPDGVAVGLVAWVIYLATDRRRGCVEAAGLLLAAAFTVKHNMAALGFPLAIAIALREGVRPAARFAALAAVPAGLFTLLLELRSGHFLDYTLRVPASHPNDLARILPGTPGELALWLPGALLVGCGWLSWRLLAGAPSALVAALASVSALFGAWCGWLGDTPGVLDAPPAVTGAVAALLGFTGLAGLWRVRDRRPDDARVLGAWLLGGTLLGVVGLMRGHNGGFANVLMPAHWAIAAGFVVAASEIVDRRPRGGRAAVALVAIAQLGGMAWAETDRDVVPTAEDVAGGDAVVARVRSVCPEGPILAPYAPWVARRAGREPGFHLIALWDVSHPSGPFWRVAKRMEGWSEEHHWACAVTNPTRRLGYGVEKAYPESHVVPLSGRIFGPKTGWPVRANAVRLPGPAGAVDGPDPAAPDGGAPGPEAP